MLKTEQIPWRQNGIQMAKKKKKVLRGIEPTAFED